jgi:deoxycytidine triphosphate deaminase
MILTDGEIRGALSMGDISIDPLNDDQIGPASVDLRLGDTFAQFDPDVQGAIIDSRKNIEQFTETFQTGELVLDPDECVLGTTVETVGLGDQTFGQVEGRSSIGRLFVEVHKTAGVIDPGFTGEITLEIHNDLDHPVSLYSGQRVCQIVLTRLNNPVEQPYDSKYQGQTGPTPSRIEQD